MRNTFLITAVLFCLVSAAVAADRKKDAEQQSPQTKQTQMARNDADGSMDHAASAKNDHALKAREHSKRKNLQHDPEGDPQASQNQVEYGGGG
jgi:hypothetical protein